jgi:hypothetical protein
MYTNMRNRTLIAAVLALATARFADAQSDVGARASGMAGAFVAVADDATAVYWNPAGVATGSIVSVVLDAGRFRLGSNLPQTAPNEEDTGAIVALSATAIGLAYYRLGTYGIGAAEPVVMGPQSREEVRRSVHALTTSTVGVSLVQSINEHIVVGVTPKVMWGGGHSAVDVDAGVMTWVNHIRFGLVARNLTTPEFGEDGTGIELEREVRVGGAWGSGWTGISRVIASFDADVMSRTTPAGDRRDVAAGVETWWMSQRLGLRGGWRRSTIGDARAAVAAGISAGLKPGMLVEAHVVRGRDDDERSWSVGVRMTF